MGRITDEINSYMEKNGGGTVDSINKPSIYVDEGYNDKSSICVDVDEKYDVINQATRDNVYNYLKNIKNVVINVNDGDLFEITILSDIRTELSSIKICINLMKENLNFVKLSIYNTDNNMCIWNYLEKIGKIKALRVKDTSRTFIDAVKDGLYFLYYDLKTKEYSIIYKGSIVMSINVEVPFYNNCNNAINIIKDIVKILENNDK